VTPHWFVRHGQSVANAEGWLSGWIDVALTELGVAEARALAEAVRALPVGRCLVSDLARARHTAELALALRPDVPVHVEPALRERHLGAFQGRRKDDLFADAEARRHLRQWDQAPEGAEPHAVVVARAMAALRRWHDGTPTLVVAHGALVRNVLGVLDGLDPAAIMQQPPAGNACLVLRALPSR
jgi:broad specificity phosphatase PhoE